MNTHTTTATTTTNRLTAADLENLDVEELLRNIFGPDVPLRDVLKDGLVKVEQTEKMLRKQARAERRAEKKEAREIRAAENAGVRAEQIKLGIHVVAAGAMGGAAAGGLGNPFLFGGLALTQAARAARSARDLKLAINVRNALRNGDVVVEASTVEALQAALGESRFQAVLALLDAGMLAGLGFGGKDPVWAMLAGLDFFIGLNEGAKWSRFARALDMEQVKAEAKGQAPKKAAAKKTSAAAKGGAHKAQVRV